ncbi:MAG: acyl-CoA thioesterase [Methanobrevibacter sp.]|jgi:acyl-CoA thioester hydrolase|nr:acyl-CoA thioesterase [Candidatus Methanovirga meridionalis]
MFKIKITPKFGDVDGLKHITNTILADWFETGRNDIFKFFTPDFDLSYEKWKLIMARTSYDFVGQMYLGKDVEIRTFILKIGNSSFTIGHEAHQDGELKVKGEAVCVHFDFIEQKSKPIPDDIRKKLEKHII